MCILAWWSERSRGSSLYSEFNCCCIAEELEFTRYLTSSIGLYNVNNDAETKFRTIGEEDNNLNDR